MGERLGVAKGMTKSSHICVKQFYQFDLKTETTCKITRRLPISASYSYNVVGRIAPVS